MRQAHRLGRRPAIEDGRPVGLPCCWDLMLTSFRFLCDGGPNGSGVNTDAGNHLRLAGPTPRKDGGASAFAFDAAPCKCTALRRGVPVARRPQRSGHVSMRGRVGAHRVNGARVVILDLLARSYAPLSWKSRAATTICLGGLSCPEGKSGRRRLGTLPLTITTAGSGRAPRAPTTPACCRYRRIALYSSVDLVHTSWHRPFAGPMSGSHAVQPSRMTASRRDLQIPGNCLSRRQIRSKRR